MLAVKQAVVDPQAANLTLQQATEVAIGEPVEAAALPPRAAAQVVATWTADDVAHDVWADGMPLLFTGHSQAFSDEGDTVADSTKVCARRGGRGATYSTTHSPTLNGCCLRRPRT